MAGDSCAMCHTAGGLRLSADVPRQLGAITAQKGMFLPKTGSRTHGFSSAARQGVPAALPTPCHNGHSVSAPCP